MAEELIIPVVLDNSQAKAQLKELHGAAQQQISATAKSRQDADKQAARDAQQSARERAKAEKDLARQIADTHKEVERAGKAAAKEVERQVIESRKAEAAAARESARQQRDFARETAKAEKDAERERADESRRQAKERERQIREEEKSAKDAARRRVEAQKKADREATESIKEEVAAVDTLASAFMSLTVVQKVADLIRQGMQAVGQSIQDARNYIKEMVSEMEAARKEAKELAALRGQGATGAFTAQLAREAAEAGVDVQQYQQFSTAYEAYTGQYTGKEGATPAQLQKEGKRISKDQALGLQKRVAGYAMGARGLSADDSAQLLGLVIAKSKAGATNDEIMTDYAKLMKVAELAPGRTSPMLSQITELGMENVGPQGDMKNVMQAAYLTRVMAQRNPQEASTYGRALMRGLRDIRKDPAKMQELGITKDMDVFQQIQAVDKAVAQHVAGGGDQGQFLSKYFKDIREWGGIQTAINEGTRGGGFQRAEAEAASVNAETARQQTIAYQGGEEGRAAKDRAEELAIQRERASKYAELRHIQSEARKAMVASGEMEMPENMVGAFLTQGGTAFGQGSRQEQEERVEVGRMIQDRLMRSAEGRKYLESQGVRYSAITGEPSQLFGRDATEHALMEAANELKRIRELQEQQSRQKEGNAPAPMVAAPPNAAGGKRP